MNWNESYDVVVIGSGVSGLAAALDAACKGLKPIVLEKAEQIGGGSCYSYGLIWVGGNPLQLAAGYRESDDEVRQYMAHLGGGQIDQERLDAYVDKGPETIAAFMKAGLKLRLCRGLTDHYYGMAPGASAEGRSLEAELISSHELGALRDRIVLPPHTPYWATAEEAVSWGGMSNFSNWDPKLVAERKDKDLRGLGVGLVMHFVKALQQRSVPIHTGAAVAELVGQKGGIRGVVTRDGRRIEARLGVVVSTGGYENNPTLVAAYEDLPGWEPQTAPTVTGDGMVMGVEHGAAVRLIHYNLTHFLGFRITPNVPNAQRHYRLAGIIELCSPHTLVVNRDGRRFADEAYFQGIVPALRQYDVKRHAYTNLPCYLVFDQQFADTYSFGGAPAGTPIPAEIPRADDLGALAKLLGIPPAALKATVRRFNGFATAGLDKDFHRGERHWTLAQPTKPGKNRSLGPLEKPPFYAVELRPSGISSAGLVADANAQVMHVRGRPIPGLYATGNTAAHTEFGVGYQAGYSLASGMIFGRAAVDHMIAAAKH
jgi:3-oxosteroid 1-dehydrogenase